MLHVRLEGFKRALDKLDQAIGRLRMLLGHGRTPSLSLMLAPTIGCASTFLEARYQMDLLQASLEHVSQEIWLRM
ncbi:hypothetical protein D3C73_1590940 [compost metagenome]